MNPEAPKQISEVAKDLINQVNQYMQNFGEPIEKIKDILGSDTVKEPSQTILVGAFDNDSNLTAWGRTLGESLELLLSDLPALGIQVPLNQLDPHPDNKKKYVWGVSGYASSHCMKTMKKLAELAHIPNMIGGQLSRQNDGVCLSLEWHDLKQGEVLQSTTLFSDDEQPFVDLLVGAASWALEQIGHLLNDQQIDQLRHYCPAQDLETYQKIMLKLGDRDWSYLPKTKVSGFEMATLPALAYFLMDLETNRATSLECAFERYDTIASQWHNHLWFLCLQSSKYRQEEDFDLDREGAKRLLNNYISKPHHHHALHQIIYLLHDSEQHRRAMGLAAELLKRDPMSFTSWWTYQWSLISAAWDYRGEDWISNVSKTYQDVFSDLADFSLIATDVALDMQPLNPQLFESRICVELGATEKLWDLLCDSVDVDPSYSGSFDAALNFTQPRWGGWLDYQMHIVKLAYKHNPKARWPLELYSEYVEQNSDYGIFTRLKLLSKRMFSKNWPANYPTDDSEM